MIDGFRRHPQAISRRQLLKQLAAITGASLIASCRTAPPPTPPLPPTTTPTAIARTTIVATPSNTPTLTLTPTIAPSATPPATATPIATITPFTPTATPTMGSILLPNISNGATVTPTPTRTPQPPTATPTLRPTAIPQPTNTVAPAVLNTPTPAATATPAPTPTDTATPTPTPPPCITPMGSPPEVGAPRVGLHASADPRISDAERCMFLDLHPSLIKVLTFHPPPDIARLAASQPQSHWIVRTFLEFGGRAITPEQFVEFTLSDTQRTVNLLAGRSLVVELHNEPNLVAEGLSQAWANGVEFGTWWLTVLEKFRAALPGIRFIYPGLSPGASVPDVRESHTEFLEGSRTAVEAADGLGIHLYWSAPFPMSQALATLDDYIGRFPQKPIYITEASYNSGGISDADRAAQYLTFINELKSRPIVQGVTFFVASASNPVFADEAWLGKDVARIVGER